MYDDLCVNVVCDLCKVFVVFFKFLKFCFIKFYLGCWNMGFGNEKKDIEFVNMCKVLERR